MSVLAVRITMNDWDIYVLYVAYVRAVEVQLVSLPPGSVLCFTIQWLDNPEAFKSTTQSIILMCLSAAFRPSSSYRSECHTHTTRHPLFPVHTHISTHSSSSQPHLPFWSSWVRCPFYKQVLMTSQQDSSQSEHQHRFLVNISCLQCTDRKHWVPHSKHELLF